MHPSPTKRNIHPFLALPMSLFLSCLVYDALAEGAVRIFSCDMEQLCDERGNCESETGKVEFHMTPIQLDDQGAGIYQLAYEDKNVAMQAISDAGPFTWLESAERHTLLVNAETQLLWHSLSFASGLHSSTRYLQCRLQQ